jgi:hypothetical protein
MANGGVGRGSALFGLGFVAGTVGLPLAVAADPPPTYSATVGAAAHMSGQGVAQTLDPATVGLVVVLALALAVLVAAMIISRNADRAAVTARPGRPSPDR